MLLSSLVRMAGQSLRVRGRGISAAWAMGLATAITTIPGIGVVGVMGASTALAQECDPVEIAKLHADDGEDYDELGLSVSVDGNTAVFGAPFDDDNGDRSGSVYVFTRSGGKWRQKTKLLPADGTGSDGFGHSASIDGTTAVVGTRHGSDNGTWSGSAYVFVYSEGMWTEQAKILPNDGAEGERFGWAVSLCDDTVLIGARADDDNGQFSGSAYMFTRSGGVWTQQAKLLPGDGVSGDEFGCSVSLDGDTAVIGASGDRDNGTNSGSAYVFVRSDGVWIQQAKLLAGDGAFGDEFGVSVSLSGDTAVVGAYQDDDNGDSSGSAYVFTRSGGMWTQHAKLLPGDGGEDDRFGRSVSVYGDTAVVGARLDDDGGWDAGSAYVFTRNQGVWTQQSKLLPSQPTGSDYFGITLSLSGDTVVIGAYGDRVNGISSGAVYVFDLNCMDCPADLNGDGDVNSQDFYIYLYLWNIGDQTTDWDENGLIDTRDFVAFLGDWAAGCP